MNQPTKFEVDILAAVARIQQAHEQPSMADYLLERLATCDVPRLLAYVSPGAKEWAAQFDR